MDKTEYQIKLDEINRLVNIQEYEDALEIIDTIEWKRVKSARTLCMVAEVYEINGELEDSMKILQMAHKRSSLGKTILYRQVELALKMKKYNDAVKYYNKYLEAASNDTTKYILKYKIYKAQKAPLEDLITILEEYKDREYTERWVYELARLYRQTGNQRKCIETCDDLILWFGEGKFVIKAMELKMKYVPLSITQKEKYELYQKQELGAKSGKTTVDAAKSVIKPRTDIDEVQRKLNSDTVVSSVKPTVEAVKSVKLPTDPIKSIVKPPVEGAKTEKTQKKLVHPSFESISAAARNTAQKAPNYIKKELTFVLPEQEQSKELLKEAAVTVEATKKPLEKEVVIEENIKKEDIFMETTEKEEVLSAKVEDSDVLKESVEIKEETKTDAKGTEKENVVVEELSVEAILAAAAAEIMAEKEAEENVLTDKEKVNEAEDIEEEEPIQNIVVDNEELQKNLVKSLEQVFAGLHRTKTVQTYESFGEENIEDYLMKELAPENANDTFIDFNIEEKVEETEAENETTEETEVTEEVVEEVEMEDETTEETEVTEEVVEEVETEDETTEETEVTEEVVEEVETEDETTEETEVTEEVVEETETEDETTEETEVTEEVVEEVETEDETTEETEVTEEVVEEVETEDETTEETEVTEEVVEETETEDETTEETEVTEEVVEETETEDETIEETEVTEEVVEETETEDETTEETEVTEEVVEEVETEDETTEETETEDETTEETEVTEEVVEETETEDETTEVAEEKAEETNIDIDEFDLEALFAETSSDFAKMIESFANEKKEEAEENVEIEQENEEESKEEEESEEPETEQENEEESKEEEESEELETEQENEEESNENDESKSEDDLVDFESFLLEALNSIPGLEDYQIENKEETPTEIEEVSEEETSTEVEEVLEEETPTEVEEVLEEEISTETEEVLEEETSTETEEISQEETSTETEEISQETSVEIENISDDFEINEMIINNALMENLDKIISNELVEEDFGFDFDFESKLIAETELILNRTEAKNETEAETEVESETENETEEKPEIDLVERLMMEADKEPSTYQSLANETPEDKRRRILNEECQVTLTEEQKALFSYFCKVPGMNNQILDAINGVYRYADERTSRRGNIAIMGSHGMGKTRLGEGLVKAICKQFGIQAAKYARVDASELNKKDIATVVGKMAGGFLMVERAHLMTPATVGQLATAMEFRTDGMVLIIEDEKKEMRQLLAEYPHFAEKIETVISIPVFTNDELVTFARTYAKENGFKMDELGILALYALIGDNQREDEPVTIGRVKSMMDMAIRHATSARLGRRISKRHVDESGRILLYEKDFED